MTTDLARLRRALELVTAGHLDPAMPGQLLAEDFPRTGQQGLIDTTMGLIDLCEILLVKRRKETGAPIPAQLDELGTTLANPPEAV